MLASQADDKKKIVLREVVSEDVTVTTEKTYDEVVEEISAKFQNITKVLPLSIYQADGQRTRNISVRVFYEKS